MEKFLRTALITTGMLIFAASFCGCYTKLVSGKLAENQWRKNHEWEQTKDPTGWEQFNTPTFAKPKPQAEQTDSSVVHESKIEDKSQNDREHKYFYPHHSDDSCVGTCIIGFFDAIFDKDDDDDNNSSHDDDNGDDAHKKRRGM